MHPTLLFFALFAAFSCPAQARTIAAETAFAGFSWAGRDIVGWEDGRLLRRDANGRVLFDYGAPPGYRTFNSLVTSGPDGTIWVGFTTRTHEDDRLYALDPATAQWRHAASVPGIQDLAFDARGQLYASGLASPTVAHSAVWLVDPVDGTLDQILAVPGLSSGLALDRDGNLYYAPVELGGSAMLARYDAARVREAAGAATLTPADGEALATAPGNIYDVDIDDAGRVLFTVNDEERGSALIVLTPSGPEVLAHKDSGAFFGGLSTCDGTVLLGDLYAFGLTELTNESPRR